MRSILSKRLVRAFYLDDPVLVAQKLLGKILVVQDEDRSFAGIITETEAYTQTDEASHSFKGKTARTGAMFAVGGVAYVYRIYGIYDCFNIVTEDEGVGCAVLVRSLQEVPSSLLQKLPIPNIHSLPSTKTNGPGKICRELGITRNDNFVDLVESDRLYILDVGCQPKTVETTVRVGISKAKDKPWRFVAREFFLP